MYYLMHFKYRLLFCFVVLSVCVVYILNVLGTNDKQPSNLVTNNIVHKLPVPANYSQKKEPPPLQNLCDFYSEGVNIHNYHTLDDHTCKLLADSCHILSCSAAIDIVVLWVDINDENMEKLYYSVYESVRRSSRSYSPSSFSLRRFRDFNQLKYLMRSIEEHGNGWARRIFLVTNNQVPEYLNSSHPRIRLVNHEQLLKYMNMTPPKHPLFNSKSIQSMVHNIPTLSSPFYLFDDDMFVMKNFSLSMILDGNKSIIELEKNPINLAIKPKVLYYENVHSAIKIGLRNGSRDLLGGNNSYRINVHGPLLLYREIGRKIWDELREEMELLLSHPFRMSTDPKIQLLYMYIGYSDYYTFMNDRGTLRFIMLTNSNVNKLQQSFQNASIDKDIHLVCVNDDLGMLNERIENSIETAYESIFSKRASFENNQNRIYSVRKRSREDHMRFHLMKHRFHSIEEKLGRPGLSIRNHKKEDIQQKYFHNRL